MRKTPLRKKSVQSISLIQNKIWDCCKQIVRKKYVNKDGSWNCYTCNIRITHKSDAQTGHFIAKAACGANLKYDLRNLRVQCMTCNIWKGGNGAIFYKNMVEREGQKYVDKIFRDKEKTVKAHDFYIELLEKYQKYAGENL